MPELIGESSCTLQWGGTCQSSLESLAVLYNGAGHAPKREFFVLRSLTRACLFFLLRLFFEVFTLCLCSCMFVSMYISICCLWRITAAAAARHAGSVNFGPTASRSNVERLTQV